MPRVEETATSLLQPANQDNEETSNHRTGEEILQKAMAG